MIIAGNKCDIINQTVQKEEADAFARSKGITHLHTSAANGTNVEYIFTQLAESKSIKSTWIASRNSCLNITVLS